MDFIFAINLQNLTAVFIHFIIAIDTMDIYGSVFEDAHVEAAHVLDNIFTGLLKENPSDS